MPDQKDDKHTAQAPFMQRWSQRKLANRTEGRAGQIEPPAEQTPEQPPQSTQQSLPPIESLHEGSDIGMFLVDGVSESLQRQALRKLFHFGKFNVCDGLDDYAEDYTIFKPLEKLVEMQDKLQDIGERLQTQSASEFESTPASVSNAASENEDDANETSSATGREDEKEA